MKLTLAYSPCPNDTFIFDALVHGKIDTEGLIFDVHLADVETLNQLAFEGTYDITKLSFHAWCHIIDRYQLLSSGAALGNGVGPLLISKYPLTTAQILEGPVAMPGKYTTAKFLCDLAYPGIKNYSAAVFSDIERQVLENEAVAGVIIHENRFTYQEKGLHKIVDLGDWWEQQTQGPIPLGGIAAHRNLPFDVQQKVARLIHTSIAFAFADPQSSAAYVAAHAQEMSALVRHQHIALYVNDFSLDLGITGRKAVLTLLDKAVGLGLVPPPKTADWLVQG